MLRPAPRRSTSFGPALLLSQVHEAAMCADIAASWRPLPDGLRAAGHYLDKANRRLVSLVVVPEGIVVTMPAHDRHGVDEAVLLTNDDLVALCDEAHVEAVSLYEVPHLDPLFLTGYQDVLSAIGEKADRQNWTCLRLVRIGDVAIIGVGLMNQRQEIVLAVQDVEALVN